MASDTRRTLRSNNVITGEGSGRTVDDIRGGGQGKQLNLIQAPASNAMTGQHGTTEKLLSSLTTHIQAIQTTLTSLTSKLDENTSMVNDLGYENQHLRSRLRLTKSLTPT